MASADHLKALLDSFLTGDEDRFLSVAMQVAANEARLGHGKLAEELRALIDRAKSTRAPSRLVPISRPRGELSGLLAVTHPRVALAQLVLPQPLQVQVARVLREQRHAASILASGLSPRRKLLLLGPPGTGKTLTASVFAGELGLPLFEVRLDALITKFMGETAAKLRQVFDATSQTRGVFFFDEFDAIGSYRGLSNDVGEARRILNSFLQLIEQDASHSLIIAATNHPELLDSALFRRFDDVLQYQLPDEDEIVELLRRRFSAAATKGISWTRLARVALGLSHAEVIRACDEVLKDSLISSRKVTTEAVVRDVLLERQKIAKHWKATR